MCCMLVAIRHHIRFHGKTFESNYDALSGSAPAARAAPVAIVPYYLCTTVQICSVPVILRHRNVPPPQGGLRWRRGLIITMKRGFLQSKKMNLFCASGDRNGLFPAGF